MSVVVAGVCVRLVVRVFTRHVVGDVDHPGQFIDGLEEGSLDALTEGDLCHAASLATNLR